MYVQSNTIQISYFQIYAVYCCRVKNQVSVFRENHPVQTFNIFRIIFADVSRRVIYRDLKKKKR